MKMQVRPTFSVWVTVHVHADVAHHICERRTCVPSVGLASEIAMRYGFQGVSAL